MSGFCVICVVGVGDYKGYVIWFKFWFLLFMMLKFILLELYCVVCWWLIFVVVLIVLMVLVGGVICLMEFGLLIVEWKLVIGSVLLFLEVVWNEVFEVYKKIL